MILINYKPIFLLFSILCRELSWLEGFGHHHFKSYCVLKQKKATYRNGTSKIVKQFPFCPCKLPNLCPFSPVVPFKITTNINSIHFLLNISFKEVATLNSLHFYTVPSRRNPKEFMFKCEILLQKVGRSRRGTF